MKNKSEQNIKAANILIKEDNQCYAAAIHCLYYSVFQLSKYVLASFCHKSYNVQNQESKGKDSHFYICDEMGKELDKISHIAFIDYSSYYNNLKKLRKKADYSEEPITINDVERAKEKAECLNNILIKNMICNEKC